MKEEELTQGVPQYIQACPVVCQWLIYKGETYFGILNYERSIRAKRAMIDLSYCATRAFNGIVIKTVRYDARKFEESPLEKL